MSYSIRVVTGDTRHTFSISGYRHIAEELGPIFGYRFTHGEDHINPDGYWEGDGNPCHWDFITSAAYAEGRAYAIEQDLDVDSWPEDYCESDWSEITIVSSSPGVEDSKDLADWYAACDYLMLKCESYLPIQFDSYGPNDSYNSLTNKREWHHGITIDTVYVAYDDDNDRPDDSYYTKDISGEGYYRTKLTRKEIDGVCGPGWTVHDNSDTNAWDDTSLWLMLVPADTTRFECGG